MYISKYGSPLCSLVAWVTFYSAIQICWLMFDNAVLLEDEIINIHSSMLAVLGDTGSAVLQLMSSSNGLYLISFKSYFSVIPGYIPITLYKITGFKSPITGYDSVAKYY